MLRNISVGEMTCEMICDQCGNWLGFAITRAEIRRMLRKSQGRIRRVGGKEQHLCWNCARYGGGEG